VVWHPENLLLGNRVDIGAFTVILAHNGVVIEDDVQIGSHCSIYSLDTERNVSGSVRILKVLDRGRVKDLSEHHNRAVCEIGANSVSMLMSVVTLIVSPMSLLLKPAKDGAMVCGIPASKLDEKMIEKECVKCGTTFLVEPYREKNSKVLF